MVDLVLMIVFTGEMLMKITAFGPWTYIDGGWNRLDCFVVVMSYVTLIPGLADLVVMRLLRVFRPLRIINKLEGMKAIVQTLMMSAAGLRDTCVLCVFIFFMFGIVGDTLFGGVLRHKCFSSTTSGSGTTWAEDATLERMCGGHYQCPDTHRCMFSDTGPAYSIQHFNHIGAGFLAIFVAITLEGWVDLMYNCQDGYSYWASTIYFHLLVIVGSLFAVNLALAVISDCFDQTVDKDGDVTLIDELNVEDLTEEELQKRIESEVEAGLLGPGRSNNINRGEGHTLSMSTMTIVRKQKRLARERKELKEAQNPPNVVLRVGRGFTRCMSGIESSQLFDNFLLFCILANTVTLACEHSPTITVTLVGSDGVTYTQQRAGEMDQTMKDGLELTNYVFVLIFTLEFLIKVIALGTEKYWDDSFNRFDFFVVVMSYVEFLGSSTGSYTVLRTFRLMRLLKVVKRWKAMQTILRCIIETLPSMGYLSILLLLFMFIMAIAGMFLFGAKFVPSNGFEEVPRANFDNFGVAMLTVFQMLSGENWNDVLHDGIFATSWITALYFLVVICIGTFIILNLTLAILLSNFDDGDYGEKDMYTIEDVEQGVSEFLEKNCSCFFPEGERTAKVHPEEDTDDESEGEIVGGDDVAAKYEVGSTSETGKGSGNGLSSPARKNSKGNGDMFELSARAPDEIFEEGDERALDGILNHVKGTQLDGMMERVRKMKVAAELGHYWHQLVINFRYHDPKLEASVLHASMSTALAQHDAAVNESIELEDELKDCTGFIPGETPVLIGYSFFIFGPENPIRVALAPLVVHPLFENFILCCIVASSVTLAMDGPENITAGSTLEQTLAWLDICFTVLFTVELMMKVVVYGLVLGEGAYLKDWWNRLDAFIVLVSILSLVAAGSDGMDAVRSLRTLRALRPLRTIKRAPGLRCVVEAIIRCMPPFINIAMVSSVFYLIFAIMGVQFWAGKFWRCNDGSVSHADNCIGLYVVDGTNTTRKWSNAPIHFDNVHQGMLTLFEVASLELWLDVMYNAMDVPSEINIQPVRDQSFIYCLYFVVFVIVGAFLIANLFVGAVVDTFTIVKYEQDRQATMTPEQAEFVSSMRNMMLRKPVAALIPCKEGDCCYGFRMAVYNIVQYDFEGKGTGTVFDGCIITLICLNILVMSLVQYQIPPDGTVVGTQEELDAQSVSWNSFLENINLFFTGTFCVEAILKLVALGISQYFGSYMNCFDFFVVVVSVVGDVFERFSGGGNMELLSILQIFRAMRVMRIFRLVTRFKGVRRLLETLLYTLPSLMNVTTLLIMVLFIYTILGMNFFGGMPLCGDADQGPCPYGLYTVHANFNTFHIGFFTLFRMSTGESWNGIMHDCTAMYGGHASLFFVSYMIIGSSLMFNLVVAVLLDEFSSMGKAEAYEVTPDAIDNFAAAWQDLDPTGSYEIPASQLVALLKSVPPPLGVGPNGDTSAAHLHMLKVNAPLNNGNAHFVETFVSLVRHAYKVDHLDKVLYQNVVSQLISVFGEVLLNKKEAVHAQWDSDEDEVDDKSEALPTMGEIKNEEVRDGEEEILDPDLNVEAGEKSRIKIYRNVINDEQESGSPFMASTTLFGSTFGSSPTTKP